MEEKIFWVGFNHVRGIGAVRLKALLDHFGSLEQAWNAPTEQLSSAGLNQRVIENILRLRSQIDLELIWKNINKQQIKVITWMDEQYPKRLKEIDQPPPVLYFRGELLPADDWAIAIVGTRRMTTYGRQVTEDVSSALVRNGFTIVSGLARGIDSVAHQAAIKSTGRTIGVLGCGVDQIYPPENRKLAEEIVNSGAIISEYAPGTPPDSNNFPPRNRIISGLAQAVVIIEAGETSGALITGSFAAEQGREVFAVPGGIYSPQSKGCNRLIRDGAHPLLTIENLLEILNVENVQAYKQARLLIPADEIESKLLTILNQDNCSIDELTAQTGLAIDQVSATLIMMELKGMIRQSDSATYMLIKEPFGEYRVDSKA